MHNIFHRTDNTLENLVDIAFFEYTIRYIKRIDQLVHVHKDRVRIEWLIFPRRDIKPSADGIGLSGTRFVVRLFSEVVIYHLYKTRSTLLVHAFDGVIDAFIVVSFSCDSLIIQTQDDMCRGLYVFFLLTCRIGLISDQRLFGSEDTHIVDHKVVSVPTGSHVVNTHTEMMVFDMGVKYDREVDLIPSVLRLYIARHVGSDVLPVRSVH